MISPAITEEQKMKLPKGEIITNQLMKNWKDDKFVSWF
jgi:hypothetical protein